MPFAMSVRIAPLLTGALLFLASGRSSGAEMPIGTHRFTVPDGFTIEACTTTDLVERPITAAFDEQGALYVADSSGSNDPVQQQLKNPTHRIMRLVDQDGDGRFDAKTAYADKMMFPEGTMWFDGSLYVSAPPSIWKLTDRDGDGVAEERVEWFQGKTLTGCANDLHGPYLGPDGWIYWCKGAFAEQTYDRPGRTPLVTKASHIFRCRPDGSKIESVMTGGMDNPVDVAFLPTGERFLSCTFFQNPSGGNRDGLIHALYGGLFGKVHAVLDGHPRTYPNVLPVFDHLGPAAPCGLHRLESRLWGDSFHDNLVTCCFNLHKVTRHKLTPVGGTFRSETSDLVVSDNIDFHPTDVVEDADGSLLIVDTGGWYKLCCPTSQLGKPDVLGAIYRIRPTGMPKTSDPRGLKLTWTNVAADDLAKRLTDPRPAVRSRTRQAFRAAGEAGVRAFDSLVNLNDAAACEAVWAASWIDHPAARDWVRKQLGHSSEAVQRVALHVAGTWKDESASKPAAALLASKTPTVRRAAAEALSQIGGPVDVATILNALAGVESDDWASVHALTDALLSIAAKDETLAGLQSTSPTVRRSVLMALEQIAPAAVPVQSVLESLRSPNSDCREAAQWVIGRHPEWGSELVSTFSQQIRSATLEPEAERELAQQIASLTSSSAIQEMLGNLLKEDGKSAAVSDRVLAILRASQLKAAPASWIAALDTDLARRAASPQPTLQTIRAVAIPRDHAAALVTQLVRLGRSDKLPPAVRLEAIASIPGGAGTLSDEQFALAESALSNDALDARNWGVSVLATAKLTPDQRQRIVPLLGKATPLELDRLVGLLAGVSDVELQQAALAAIEASDSFRSLRPDVLRTVFGKEAPESVAKQRDELIAKLNVDLAKQQTRLEETLTSLPAGDVRRGQLVFTNKKFACTSCHAIGYLGGKIGPDLTRIGQIRVERDLLEAILFPSASFVRSYEPLMVVTTSGLTHSGLVKRDTPEEIVLTTKPDQEVRIPRLEIEEVRPGTVSIMPAGLDQQLSAQELADLVAFLRACK